jgi:cyclic pyranopterin phosphate synthase
MHRTFTEETSFPFKRFGMVLMEDKYGRTFKTLRVSLLNHCNLGCVYCVAGDDELKMINRGNDKSNGEAGKPHLSVNELLDTIGRLHALLQFDTIRLTGGEPTLYHGLTKVIEGIRGMGIPGIKLTTNGFLLKRLAVPMKQAGMESINVSLDAIDEDVFFRMSKRKPATRILDGIDAALQAGLEVKINTVVMKGMNDSQILPLMEFAFSRNIRIRFLEVMAMGHLHDQSKKYLFSQEEILTKIAGYYRYSPMIRAGSATSNYWKTEAGGIFGVIANESEPFCGDCNRLRLDSQGNIYGCLSSNHPIPLNGTDGERELNEKLRQALSQKQTVRFTGSDLSMLHIGG